MILMQTKALFVDAYRELNAKKLFWISLGLNLLGVIVFASVGINNRGFQLLFWTFDGMFNTSMMSKEVFYKLQFSSLAVPYWLTWGTTILALISTAGIIPDLISSGTIEPVLSKPISRVRLFLTKYLTGLFFVLGQILVFCFGCFLVLGIRAGAWEFGLFLAVPIVLAFFSYLFSLCALVGILTRSTIAALLLTLLFWGGVFVVNISEAITITTRITNEIRVEDAQPKIDAQVRFAEARIEQFRENGRAIPGEGDEILPPEYADSLEAVNPVLRTAREEAIKAEGAYETWLSWEKRFSAIKFVLPKTQETIGLLQEHLLDPEDLEGFIGMMEDLDENQGGSAQDSRSQDRLQAVYDKRNLTWILGTSFGFEAIMLFAGCWIFCRRDF